MSHQFNLNERSQNILKATIQHYIATAEPVGSKTLVEEYGFKISSATIRNIMGRLEEAGFLFQPHTSAGRIPSDWGYRIYVDRLINPDEISSKQLEQSLHQKLQWERVSFENLLQRVTKILAALSGYIALITFPQNPSDSLRHLQLVYLPSGQIMLVIVTDSYQTQSVLVESSLLNTEQEPLDEELIESELQILSNFLNQKLKGQTLMQIASLDWEKIDREFVQYTGFIKIIAKELHRLVKPNNSTPIVIHGVAEVLRQPEFSQLQQVQTLLYLLEEKQEQLFPVIFTIPELSNDSKRVAGTQPSHGGDGTHRRSSVKIKIGSENPLEPMRICTLVAANYYHDDTPVGSVGIIGPTRMLYQNAIALVETTADYLSDALS
ncbi:MAG: heat-inducible transcriptional repressor HrcA [Stanieria sp.]